MFGSNSFNPVLSNVMKGETLKVIAWTVLKQSRVSAKALRKRRLIYCSHFSVVRMIACVTA